MILKTHNLSKFFEGLRALDGVSISVPKEALTLIIGPNGSGKTTFINTVTGFYRADDGRVEYEGRDITILPTHRIFREGIVRTFQIPRPFGSATVRENVAIGAMFGRASMDVEDALREADEYLKLIGIYQLRDKEARLLTPLEKRFMELARALAMKPKMLLLDEVMAGMHPSDIDKIIEILQKIRREEHVAVVSMVEHLMHAITRFAERVVVMHQGKKLIEGETTKVLNDPRVIEVYLGKKVM